MAYNWQSDLEKLYRAYDRACEDRDVSKQESLVKEIIQIEDIIAERQRRELNGQTSRT